MGNELYGAPAPATSVPFKLGRPNLHRDLVTILRDKNIDTHFFTFLSANLNFFWVFPPFIVPSNLPPQPGGLVCVWHARTD
jgi:hypothetical protein